jgi:hypothetical protein
VAHQEGKSEMKNRYDYGSFSTKEAAWDYIESQIAEGWISMGEDPRVVQRMVNWKQRFFVTLSDGYELGN